jgi:hypothetical protein
VIDYRKARQSYYKITTIGKLNADWSNKQYLQHNKSCNKARNAINKILDEYHYFKIAASQVDIIAHSMGGLMARGFVQQPDYKGKKNYYTLLSFLAAVDSNLVFVYPLSNCVLGNV